MSDKKVLNVWMPYEFHRDLKTHAAMESTSMTQLILRVMGDYMETLTAKASEKVLSPEVATDIFGEGVAEMLYFKCGDGCITGTSREPGQKYEVTGEPGDFEFSVSLEDFPPFQDFLIIKADK